MDWYATWLADSIRNLREVDLVGHDWGGLVAWIVAAHHHDRLASLTVLSRPHPLAFRRAFEDDADGQRHRSRHHQMFQDPAVVSRLVADDASVLRKALPDGRVPKDAVDEYLALLGQPAALNAALAWYRAAGSLASIDAPVIQVPTLYLWGDADSTVGATAARLTAEYVAGPFRFEILRGIGHFMTDEVPDLVTAHLLAHIEQYPG
jgi:pimeloyl-ACP methyl ester carboxylesterase